MGSSMAPFAVHLSKEAAKNAVTLPVESFIFYIRHGYGDYRIVAALLCCTERSVIGMVQRGELKSVAGPGTKRYIPLMQLAAYFDLEGMLDRQPLLERMRALDIELRQKLQARKSRLTRMRQKHADKFIKQLATPTAEQAEQLEREYATRNRPKE